MTNPKRRIYWTEYAAGIEPSESFDPSTFRSIDLAPGVRAIIARRPGRDTTETQAIRFAAQGPHRFDKRGAQTWLRAHGYRWITWGQPTKNPDDSTARLHVTEAAAHLKEAGRALEAPPANPCQPVQGNPPIDIPEPPEHYAEPTRIRGAWREGYRAGLRGALLQDQAGTLIPSDPKLWHPWLDGWARGRAWRDHLVARGIAVPNDPELAGLILAAGVTSKAVGDAVDRHNAKGARTTPATRARSGRGVAPRANPPQPRQLVQIGTARGLELTAGKGYRWTVGERWPVLADPGAEKGSRGRMRIFLVPPSGRKATKHPPHATSERTFKTWHSFDPRKTYAMDVPLADEFTTQLGTASSITYRSDKWQDGSPIDYIHKFSRAQLPRVSAVGPAERPRAIMIDGGRFRLTARGIVD